MPIFNYEKIGNGSKKVIMIHGFGASRKTFYDILPFFDSTEYEIFLIDLIGFGDSKFVPCWNYTIENQAKLVYSFLKNNNLEKVNLVGHSYGGGVVLLLLNMLRDKGEESIVNSAILIGPACYPQKIPFFIKLPAEYQFLYKLFMKFMPKKTMAKMMLQKLYINKELITEDKIQRYASFYEKKDNIYAIIKTAQQIIPEDIEEILDKIKFINTKTLILWGEKDFVIKKANIIRLNNDIKNSNLVTFSKTGHVVQEEKPKEVYKEISEFIRR